MMEFKQRQPLQINELPSPHFDERPDGTLCDTIIIHTMHNPTSEDKFSAKSCKECLDQHGVSAHYIIDREGGVWRTVSELKRAWHAGVSKMPLASDGREKVNAFSIGIELVGAENLAVTDQEYAALCLLLNEICSRHNIKNIYGHSDVAPGRKTDPWLFDWPRFKGELSAFVDIAKFNFPG